MYRLSGHDAFFLYSETPTALMHTLKILVLDTEVGSFSYEQLLRSISKVLPLVPVLRQKVVPVPFGLHHPVMINDPDFSLDFHVCRAALPKPGGMQELDEMVALIASHRLDRTRPLWEVWLLEGFEGDRLAVVLKMHHTLADGGASLQFLTHAWSDHALQDIPEFQAEPVPGKWQLIGDALREQITRDMWQFPGAMVSLWKNFQSIKKRRQAEALQAINPWVKELPRTRFNRALSSRRSFATVQFPLERVKRLKNRMNATVNDVLLALAAGALRRYLIFHDELPDKPLGASIPVNADVRGVVRFSGNNVADMMATLCVEIEDPIQRFYTVKSFTEAAKEELEAFGRSSWATIFEYLCPPLFTWLRQREFKLQKANRDSYRQLSNLVVSNVSGPREKLTTRFAQVVSLYSIGPLPESIGLNITVWSYDGQLNISTMACRHAVPDLRRITEAMEYELAVLEKAMGLEPETAAVTSKTPE